MTYELEYIFEGFQSRMKSKLKELSDEDEVRRKMLQNTFDSIDIDGMETATDFNEVASILSRNFPDIDITMKKGKRKSVYSKSRKPVYLAFRVLSNSLHVTLIFYIK